MSVLVPPAQLLGRELEVRCADGRMRRHVDLDYAASTPVMSAVWDAVEAFIPWYGSVHRGTGAKSQRSTAAYEGAREVVARFVGAPQDASVVFVRNTTEAINVLATALAPGARVLSTPVEHHANMLPWRRHDLELLPFTSSADELLEVAEAALLATRFDLFAVTGASNVTGEVWPLEQLARRAHAHGAELFVDAAQLAPHRPIDMDGARIDHLALSGHKLYAPFGAGALVSRTPLDGDPLLHGGGAIKLVTLDDVVWADAPDRFEAGSPNVIGAVAFAAACEALQEIGMDAVADRERALSARLHTGLDGIDGLTRLALWPVHDDRVGVASFTLDGHKDETLATRLSDEYAIAVRHGCFCAHPLITRLLQVPDDEAERLRNALRKGEAPELPGAVRASIGLGTTTQDIDALTGALEEISSRR